MYVKEILRGRKLFIASQLEIRTAILSNLPPNHVNVVSKIKIAHWNLRNLDIINSGSANYWRVTEKTKVTDRTRRIHITLDNRRRATSQVRRIFEIPKPVTGLNKCHEVIDQK